MPLPGEVKFTSSSGRRMDDFLHILWNGAETCQDSRGVIKSKGDKAAGSTSLHLRPAVRLRRRRCRHHRGELNSGPVNLAAGWPMTFISPTNTAYSDTTWTRWPFRPSPTPSTTTAMALWSGDAGKRLPPRLKPMRSMSRWNLSEWESRWGCSRGTEANSEATRTATEAAASGEGPDRRPIG